MAAASFRHLTGQSQIESRSLKPNTGNSSPTFRGAHGMIEVSLVSPITSEPASSAESKPIMVLVPGWTCSKEDLEPLALELAGCGHASVILNNPGMGLSTLGEGTDHRNYCKRAAGNVVSIMQEMAKRTGCGKFVLVGHSMGGQIVALAHSILVRMDSKSKPQVTAAILITPITDDPLKTLSKGILSTITKLGVGMVSTLIRQAGEKTTPFIDGFVRVLMRVTHALCSLRLLKAPREARRENARFWEHFYHVPKRLVTISMEAMRKVGEETRLALNQMAASVRILVIEARHDKLVNPQVGDNLIKRVGPEAACNISVSEMHHCSHFPHNEDTDGLLQMIRARIDAVK